MAADPRCPNPECPANLRRTDDTGIQAVLAAIDGVNTRLVRIDQNLTQISASVAVHDSDIRDMKEATKSHVDKRWMLVVASVGLAPTVVGWFVRIVQKL